MRITAVVKKTPFVLETVDEEIDAFFTQLTVGEANEISKEYDPIFKDENLDVIDKLTWLNKTRLVKSVKDGNGVQLFKSFDELSEFPKEAVEAMIKQVDSLNPWPKINDDGTTETLDSKKE